MSDVLTFDTETTTKAKGNPFTKSNRLISYSIKVDDTPVEFHYYNEIEFLARLKKELAEAKLVVAFNAKFDLHWARRMGCEWRHNIRVWDCQLAEYIIEGQVNRFPSLDYCCAKYGLGKKDDRIAEYWRLGVDTPDIPVEELEEYGNLDVDLTYKLRQKQLEVMTPKQIKLCLLMGLDLLVLEEMEFNGIKFNVGACEQLAEETQKLLDDVTKEILEFSPSPLINLDSGQQLSCLLYGGSFDVTKVVNEETCVYKSGAKKGQEYVKKTYATETVDCGRIFTPLRRTEYKLPLRYSGGTTTVYETNDGVLGRLRGGGSKGRRLLELLGRRAEYSKLVTTYYGSLPILLEEMEWGEYLHGQYNQCVAQTGRLSSSGPNMQNFSGIVDKLLVTRY